ncbi:MAG: hypothetical protein WCJ81_05270 [bacterium]
MIIIIVLFYIVIFGMGKDVSSIKHRISKIEEKLPIHASTAELSYIIKEPLEQQQKDELQNLLQYHNKQRLNIGNQKTITDGKSNISLLPNRGCVITELVLDGVPILFHDQ